MPIVINGALDVRWPALADLRSGPYASKAAALSAVTLPYRAIGLVLFVTVGAGLEWWQFQGDTTDDDLTKVMEFTVSDDGHVTGTDTAGGKQLDVTNWNGQITGSIGVNGGITLTDKGTAPAEGQIILNGGILQIKIGGVVKNLTS